jgi:hypothetical protein
MRRVLSDFNLELLEQAGQQGRRKHELPVARLAE